MDRAIDEHALYDCHDLLLKYKADLFDHLVGRWRDLFNVSFDADGEAPRPLPEPQPRTHLCSVIRKRLQF